MDTVPYLLVVLFPLKAKMFSTSNDRDGNLNEAQHKLSITKGFAISKKLCVGVSH